MASSTVSRCCMKYYQGTYAFSSGTVNCNDTYTFTIDAINVTGAFGTWNFTKLKSRACTEVGGCVPSTSVTVSFKLGCIPSSITVNSIQISYYKNGVYQGQDLVPPGAPTNCPAGDCLTKVCDFVDP